MIPCSSPRSSGCRATDWIMDAKMLPMPIPAPTAPSPTPRPKAIAWPSFICGAVAASRVRMVLTGSPSLVVWLDRRADVDGGQGSEDERLDRDDDDDLEQVEERRDGHRDRGESDRSEHKHQADHHE